MNCILCEKKSISDICQSMECLNISYSMYISDSNVLSNYISKSSNGNEIIFILKMLSKSLENNKIDTIFSSSKSDTKPTINKDINYSDIVKRDMAKLKELIIYSNDKKRKTQ
jgi:hypothetical protein